MTQPVIQTSFAGGELSPSLYGRVDLAKYHSGVALARNFYVDYRGGLSNRPGTKFVGQCKDSSTPNRLIQFQFSTTQTYVLVFGNGSLRFVRNGAYVLEGATAISGLTQASPGVVTDTAHGYSNGDLVYLSGIGGMVQMNGRFATVANATANTYTLVDMFGVPINTTGYGAYTSGGTAARVYTISTPYASADLALLKFAQSADVMTLTHPGYATQKLVRVGEANWTLTPVTFASSAPAPGAISAGLSVVAGGSTTYNTTQYEYVVTAEVSGVESEPSPVGTCTGPALSSNTGQLAAINWSAVTGATRYNIYRTRENLNVNVVAGSLFGYVGSATGTSFLDNNIAPDFTRAPPQANNPFTTAGNPGCVAYWQQRQVFSGMPNAPEQLDFSRSGDFFNMDYSTPSRDSDNIEITIASQQVNPVQHLVPLQSLIVLTSAGAWKIDGGSATGAVTPTQIEALPQAYNGCSSQVPPLVINYDVLYVQAKGSIVRDLSYNFYANIYTGTDLTVLSNHLFFGHQILEWCWAEEPFKIMWAVREDGVLLSLTFLKEQEIYGWARHDTDGLFKSVCSISEGNENAVYAVVERLVQGQYLQYIERFASRQLASDSTIGVPADPTKAWFVDCGLQYPQTFPNATLTPTEATNAMVIDHISVVAGGTGYTSPVVVITDPTGSGATATATVTAGVITGITVTAAGANYTRPVVTITDTAGSGAVASAAVSRPVPMNASSAIFSSGDIGKVVRINSGVGTVSSVPSSTQIVVNVSQPLANIWPAPAGSWSMTAPVSTVSGLDHLNGRTVSVLADGNVHPQLTVTAGSVTLQRAASAITVGLPYTAQMQTLYLDVQGEPVQSKRKKINAVTVRMQDTRGIKVGHTFDTLVQIKERTTEPMGQPVQLYTGDHRLVLDPLYDTKGQVCIQQDNPLPCTILAAIPEITMGDS